MWKQIFNFGYFYFFQSIFKIQRTNERILIATEIKINVLTNLFHFTLISICFNLHIDFDSMKSIDTQLLNVPYEKRNKLNIEHYHYPSFKKKKKCLLNSCR